MIAVESLWKIYGDFLAVAGSDFSVKSDGAFGVVGSDDAGKMMTLKMLARLAEPTGGSASVLGYDPEEPVIRRKLGFLPKELPLYEGTTARSYLRSFVDLYDVPRDVADERIGAVLDRLGLKYRDHRFGDILKGMKRKIVIARSFVNDPDLLIYDKPASGLDLLMMDVVLEFVREFHDENKTVVFNAHNLLHVESICDRVVIMDCGKIIARGTAPEIRAEHGETTYRVFTTVPLVETLPDNDEIDDEEHHVTVVNGMSAIESLRERAEAASDRVANIRTDEASLENIFLRLAREAPTTNEAKGSRG